MGAAFAGTLEVIAPNGGENISGIQQIDFNVHR